MKDLRSIPGITFIFIHCFVFHLTSSAQETRINGKVFDADSKEPLPFVTVVFKGTKTGTTSDIDGNFFLSAAGPADSIVISYTGYLRQAKAVQNGKEQAVTVYLKPDVVSLHEVVILPGENPALRILREVISHKPKNDRDKLSAYEYSVYNKIEFDLNNIPPEFKKKKIFKPIKFVFDYIDSTNVKEKPYLPLFLIENLSRFFYRSEPKYTKEIIQASKIAGTENEKSVSQFMGDMYQRVDLYENTILVFEKNFISPISNNGLFYYKYYLLDSGLVDGSYCYHLKFKPRRKGDLCFSGNMWIADTSFALKRLEMGIGEDANVNFIQGMNVIQEYVKVDTAWMLSKDRLVIDFALTKKDIGVYGRKTTYYKNFIINKPHDEKFYSRTEDVIVSEEGLHKDESFWKKNRFDTLSKNEAQIYKMVDTIQSLPIYKTWQDIVLTFYTGYLPWGNVELGPYYNIYSHNLAEGHRFRFGARTSDKFSKWYELNGYAAYGTQDEEFKYKAGFRSYITREPRQIISGFYKHDVEILGKSWNGFTHDNVLGTVFARNPFRNYTMVNESQLAYELEPFSGFNTQVFFVNRIMKPVGANTYNFYGNDSSIQSKDNIITSEIRTRLRFAYDEKYVEGTFDRSSTGTKYPVLTLNYSAGLKGVLNSDYKYHKLSLNVEKRFHINPLGYTDWFVEAGQVFGNAPYPLLNLHGGNETYVYDPYAYNMMNYYEFVSDRYFTAQAFHHFEGFFLNRIPLLRKLKWREVVTAKYLVGTLSDKNRNILIFPNTLTALDKGPYMEAGVGIENIFKIFRIDAIWRLSYLGNPAAPRFGIFGSIQITL